MTNPYFFSEPVVLTLSFTHSVRVSEQSRIPLVLPTGAGRLPAGLFGLRWLGVKSTFRKSNQLFSGRFHTDVYILCGNQ
jgi:hypothetical protein